MTVPARVRTLITASVSCLALTLGATAHAAAAPDSAADDGVTNTEFLSGSTATSGLTAPLGGPFGAGSVWRSDIRKAPLHGNSKAMVANLAHQVTSRSPGVAAFNVHRYNTSIYTVSASQRKVDVVYVDCQRKGHTPGGVYGEGGHFTRVPIPSGAVPSPGTDAQLAIYSPQTDQLWEFWKVKKVDGRWRACWGGRIDRVSRSQGYFPKSFGASASGLALSGGTVGIEDARAGRIDHALSLAIPRIRHWKTWSWPAQRSDGSDTRAAAIPAGTRFRLDPAVNVDSLDMTPLGKAIARAAQRHGFIVTDYSGVVAVTAESSAPIRAAGGRDPWPALMNGKPSYEVMEGFPWHRLQALPKDYGRP